LSAEAQRRRTLQVLTEWLLRLGRQQPVVLLFEDLHWADPSTLELLGSILEQLPTAGVLALYTFRPDFQPPWSPRSHVAPMLLARLTRAQVQPMVEALAHGRPVPDPWIREIARRTDGVPLFVEELTRTFLDSRLLDEGADERALEEALARLEIPATLQDSLTARLDQLGPVKEIAQLAACLGREFDFGLLLAVSPLTESDLADLLRRAVRDELLYQRGAPPAASYTFKHALIQEAAYQSLLKTTRQRHHRRIAETLEARFPELVETQPELVARHCTHAGLTERAIEYWLRAGQRALQRSASHEAIRHFGEGLRLLATLPDTRERQQRELQLRALQSLGLIAVEGYGAEGVQQSYARARELCRNLGQPPETFPVLLGLWSFYMVRSERKPTCEVSQELLEAAHRSGDDSARLEAELAAAITAFWQGLHTAASEHSARVLELYDVKRHGAHALFYGQDPAAYAHVFAAMSLWCLGHPDQARARASAACAVAENIGHPFTKVGAECFASMVHIFCGEFDAALGLATKALTVSTEQGFAMWEASAIQWVGVALMGLDRLEEGIERLREGTEKYLATGASVHVSVHFAFLARGLWGLGRRSEGLDAVEHGLSLAYTNLDRYWEPELHRVKGELLLLDDADTTSAEQCFEKAIAIAREQEAKSLELRAAMSLARLWNEQDRRADALGLLSPLYGWFAEGLDTKDLRDARALLEGLGGR
jgi:predicted ATPase